MGRSVKRVQTSAVDGQGLAGSLEHFRAVTESARYAVLTVDARHEILYLNPAADRLLGGDRLGGDVRLLVSDRHRADFEDAVAFHLRPEAHDRAGPLEMAVRRPDGSEFPAELSLAGWRHGGEAYVTLIVRDVAERTRIRRDLERLAAELRRSNAELERFAYIASHDLQEPLRMVSSYSRLLQVRYKGKLDEDADEFLHFAVDGATRMQQLITDLLAYSRVGTKGRPFEPVAVDALLDRALENLQAARQESGAEITRGPLPTLVADGSQLVQVLQNLLSNAIKFRGEAAPRIHVSAERRDGSWAFAVQDNGLGIDPKFSDRIFDVFQRLHGAKFPGTGIGLSICKRVIERHGGRIWVESRPGEGATFRFTVPDLPAGTGGPEP
jgi:PAS domain S-box-containing protein